MENCIGEEPEMCSGYVNCDIVFDENNARIS